MVPWVRTHLPTQETQVQCLVQEDDLAPPTSRRGTKPEHPSYQAHGPRGLGAGAATVVRGSAPERSLRPLQLERAQGQQQDPARPDTDTSQEEAPAKDDLSNKEGKQASL